MITKVQVYPILLRVNSLDSDLDILNKYKVYSKLENYAKNQKTYKLLFSCLESRDLFLKEVNGLTFKIASPKFFYLNEDEIVVNV